MFLCACEAGSIVGANTLNMLESVRGYVKYGYVLGGMVAPHDSSLRCLAAHLASRLHSSCLVHRTDLIRK